MSSRGSGGGWDRVGWGGFDVDRGGCVLGPCISRCGFDVDRGEQAERGAEEELARMRAAEDGRGFETHLREIRERRHGRGGAAAELDPAVEAAVDAVLRAARAGTADEAAAFLAASRARHASLAELRCLPLACEHFYSVLSSVSPTRRPRRAAVPVSHLAVPYQGTKGASLLVELPCRG